MVHPTRFGSMGTKGKSWNNVMNRNYLKWTIPDISKESQWGILFNESTEQSRSRRRQTIWNVFWSRKEGIIQKNSSKYFLQLSTNSWNDAEDTFVESVLHIIICIRIKKLDTKLLPAIKIFEDPLKKDLHKSSSFIRINTNIASL